MTARHLANLAPRPTYSLMRSAQPVEAFGDRLAGAEGQRLGAVVDLDARQRAGGLDQLGQRRAVLGLLADGLVVEDDAGDVVLHRLGGAEQHLAIVAAGVLGALGLDAVEALLDGAGALVGGQDALARRHHGLGHLLQCHGFRHGCSPLRIGGCGVAAEIARMRPGRKPGRRASLAILLRVNVAGQAGRSHAGSACSAHLRPRQPTARVHYCPAGAAGGGRRHDA